MIATEKWKFFGEKNFYSRMSLARLWASSQLFSFYLFFFRIEIDDNLQSWDNETFIFPQAKSSGDSCALFSLNMSFYPAFYFL